MVPTLKRSDKPSDDQNIFANCHLPCCWIRQAGRWQQALVLFHEMQKRRVRKDQILHHGGSDAEIRDKLEGDTALAQENQRRPILNLIYFNIF